MKKVLKKIRAFRDARDWMQFHDPKNLAISVAIEAAELLEHFQWRTPEQCVAHARREKEAVADEIADVATYLFELADNLGIDLERAMERKIRKNARKYPVAKAKGIAKKYTEL
ncbi:MAG TPA: nucleotide pyrophosphohydrolase [Elusimicrobiota bacterium]|jgi:NTP pyrophosphatase (non-canonical NTP hydrolase)|nr:nucleotide pyrophosphohydrolase [Elusimicrobiota bacterium]